MCESPFQGLEPRSLPPYFTNTYTCEVTTTPKVHGGPCF